MDSRTFVRVATVVCLLMLCWMLWMGGKGPTSLGE